MTSDNKLKTALITGSAKRLGATIAKTLHRQGYNVVIHYRHSQQDAQILAAELNAIRNHSAITVSADLCHINDIHYLVNETVSTWSRLDVLINNASEFFATPVGNTAESQWQQLMDSNVRASYFLAQAAAPHLKEAKGNIINISDNKADFPLKNYSVYSISKAALNMLTQSLAKELAPDVRVNAIAPGIMMWNDKDPLNDTKKAELIERTALKRLVNPQDIADAIIFLANQQSATGKTITIDAGRSLSI